MNGEGYWRDGDVPHVCGLYVEEHQLHDGQWICLPNNERRSA
jgi:hypothetical protein